MLFQLVNIFQSFVYKVDSNNQSINRLYLSVIGENVALLLIGGTITTYGHNRFKIVILHN